MLKCLAILTVLAFTQAPVPVPRVATAPPVSTSGNSKHHSEGDKNASEPSTPLINKQVKTISPDDHGGNQAGHDEEHTTKITDLPPISVVQNRKTGWDIFYAWGQWVFTLGLVIVGALQVWLLKQTRDDIHTQAGWMETQTEHIRRQADMAERQARLISTQAGFMAEQTTILADSVKAAQESARAAVENIDVTVSKERARLRVEVQPLRAQDLAGVAAVRFNVRYFGTTLALIDWGAVDAKLMYSGVPDPEIFPPVLASPQTISGGTRLPEYSAKIHPWNKDSIYDIENKSKIIHFYGCIRYKDFMEKKRETSFYYIWVVDDDSTAAGWWRKVSCPNYETET